MPSQESYEHRIAALEEELATLQKINAALMGRVERSADSAGNSFTLFESNIVLQQRIQERTQDLQQSNSMLQAEIEEHQRTEDELRKLQRQTRQFIDTALDAVIAFDHQWRILDWNPRAELTFGYDADYATDKLQLSSLVAPGGHDVLSHYLESLVTAGKGQVRTIELVGRHSDGREFPMELAVSILSGGNRPIYSAFIRDITERKQAEEARYRTLFDNSPVSLWEEDFSEVKRHVDRLQTQGITDLRKYFKEFPEALAHCATLARIKDVNLAATRLFRTKSKTNFCQDFNSLLCKTASEIFVSEISALAKGRSTWEKEAELKTFDGQAVHVIITFSMAPGNRESWSKIYVSAQDMTDRKFAEAEKARLEALLQQTQKMETIGTLAGGIAHDFNNMLAPILGYAEMIADDANDPEGARDASEQIIAAARRARDLVRQILTFSRGVERELKPVRIAAIVKEATDLARATLPTTVSMHLKLDDSSRVVMADPTQVHQVILNLCTNAYQSFGDATGRIDIELRDVMVDGSLLQRAPSLREGMYVLLTVRDTGCGIETSLLHRIFDPFFTTKEVGKGSGMGLSVSHGIVQALGGEILVDSVVGQGSSFYVYLPAVEHGAELKSESVSTAAGSERILVVDDEVMVAQVTKRQLERLGYVVTTETNPTNALRLFQNSPHAFDIVLTDQTMPELPGHILAKELRSIRSDIPILLLTGFAHVDVRSEDISQNISNVLQKPVSAADLSAAVRRVLEKASVRKS